MKLPPIHKLLTQDFLDQGSWIGRLFSALNNFFSSIKSALDNGLTLTDNNLCQIRTVTVNGSSPQVSFGYPYQSKPIGCLVINCTDSTGVPQTIPQISWNYSLNASTIKLIGLTAGTSYLITFYIIGG